MAADRNESPPSRKQLALWTAINKYAVAVGGNPARSVYGNTSRQAAVVEIERIAFANDVELTALRKLQGVAEKVAFEDGLKDWVGDSLHDAIAAVHNAQAQEG